MAIFGDDLTKEQVRIRDKTFTFHKMMPMHAFNLFETIRMGLKDAVKNLDMEPGEEIGVSEALEMVFSIPAETVQKAMRGLFGYVAYTSPNKPDPTPISGDEQSAFDGLLPIHIYEVLARAFVVNFRESWEEIVSASPDLAQDSTPSSTETSQHSLPTPSMPDSATTPT